MVWDETVGHGIMVKNEYFFEILNIRRDNVIEIAQKARATCKQISFKKDRRIVTVLFLIQDRSPPWNKGVLDHYIER
jgi:hypothetical protein